jgi:hypothetical protein
MSRNSSGGKRDFPQVITASSVDFLLRIGMGRLEPFGKRRKEFAVSKGRRPDEVNRETHEARKNFLTRIARMMRIQIR